MKLKLIQVGLGHMGTAEGVNFVLPSNDFEYAGIVEIDGKRLMKASEILNVPKERCYTDYKKAFQEIQADAVLITLRPFHRSTMKLVRLLWKVIYTC